MGKRLVAVLAALLAMGLIASGCGGDDDEDSGTTAATTSTTSTTEAGGGGGTSVGLTEYKFDPSDLNVSAGDTLQLTNDGQIPHNLTIVEGDPEGGGAEVAASDDIAPGESGTLNVGDQPGEYGILCTIPGHAEQGMTGTIKIG